MKKNKAGFRRSFQFFSLPINSEGLNYISLLALGGIILAFFFLAQTAYGIEYKTGGDIKISSDEVFNEHIFFASENFEFDGLINGDIAGACNEARITGEVIGDLWIAAQTVYISGKITGSAVIAAQEITIDTTLTGDILGMSQDFEVTGDSIITGKLQFFCQNMVINGPISSDVSGSAQSIKINADIGGDVDVCVQEIYINPDARVRGNLQYKRVNKIDESIVSRVLGDIFHRIPESPVKKDWSKFTTFVRIISLISYFIVGLVILLPLKKHTELVLYQQQKNIWHCLLVGFIVFVLTPVIAVILGITIIGLPLSLLLVLIFCFIWYLSSMFVMTYLGQRIIGIFKKDYKASILLSFITGLVIIELLRGIPVLGVLITLFVWFTGVGAFLISRKVLISELRDRGII